MVAEKKQIEGMTRGEFIDFIEGEFERIKEADAKMEELSQDVLRLLRKCLICLIVSVLCVVWSVLIWWFS